MAPECIMQCACMQCASLKMYAFEKIHLYAMADMIHWNKHTNIYTGNMSQNLPPNLQLIQKYKYK